MATVTCVGIILTACVFVRGYNVDTTIPVIKTGPVGSYFGYSVAQHQEVRMKDAFTPTDDVIANYLIVGAPKLDIATAPENYTGGIYKCNAVSPRADDCELLLENEYKAGSTPDMGRTDQWLGVVVRSGGAGKEVVACAHRYKTGGSNNYGIGNCYLIPQDLRFDRDLGLGNLISPCKGYSTRNEHMEYAFCQGGTSAYISDERRLIIGSPGAINWRGMLSEMDISPFGMRRKYKSPTTDADNPLPPVPTFSMLGYSVVGGKFDDSGNLYYVAGAPRSREGGEVVLFTEMSSGNLLKYEESQKIMGDLPFAGFGQDLIAVDLNNDSFDDLVIGCPMYHKKEEDVIRVGGAIYVYIGNGNMITNYTEPQIIKGRSLSQDECNSLQCLHGRFGFSLAKAGDLNGDGFQDFAVGAPYEGKGAVYIFHGSKDGVKVPFSQRIYASELPNSDDWTTFGYSLSGGIDLDDNTYPDILVGSFDVDKVALLRTRPIIYLHSNVTVHPDKLNMSSVTGKECEYDRVLKYCVQLKLCLRYTAEPAERFDEAVEIIYKIVAEPDRISPRVEFKQGTGSGSMVENRFSLLPQKLTGLSTDTGDPKYSCVTQIAYLKDAISDVVSTLEFGISYRLPERTEPIPTPFPGALPDINTYPILDAGLTGQESMVITKVEFAKKCGDNDECESNLIMDVSLNLKHDRGKPVLEQGITKELKVTVTIENTYEVAYQIMFYFRKPETLKYESSEPNIECDAVYTNKTLYECKSVGSKEIGRPLKGGEITSFTLKFGTEKVSSLYKEIEMSFWVNTTSKELTPEPDFIKIPIRVFVNADMQVTGKPYPDSNIPYSGVIRGESAISNEHMIGPSVNHTFTIYNNGPGTVQSADLTIRWPYEVASKYTHGKHLLYLMQQPQVLGGGESGTVCFENPDIINPANKQPAGEGGPEYNVVPDTSRPRRQVDDEESETNVEEPVNGRAEGPRTGESREGKRTVLLDCQSGSAKCHDIRCRIGTLQMNKQVQIKIRSRLWESTLLEDYRHVDEVQIQSMAILTIRPELNVVQSKTNNDIGYATTVAIPSLQIAPKQMVAWWIYLVAVLGGIILLIVIALILWKCGFFKRKKFDQSPTYNAKLEKNWQTSDMHASSPIYNAKSEKTYHPDEKFSFIK